MAARRGKNHKAPPPAPATVTADAVNPPATVAPSRGHWTLAAQSTPPVHVVQARAGGVQAVVFVTAERAPANLGRKLDDLIRQAHAMEHEDAGAKPVPTSMHHVARGLLELRAEFESSPSVSALWAVAVVDSVESPSVAYLGADAPAITIEGRPFPPMWRAMNRPGAGPARAASIRTGRLEALALEWKSRTPREESWSVGADWNREQPETATALIETLEGVRKPESVTPAATGFTLPLTLIEVAKEADLTTAAHDRDDEADRKKVEELADALSKTAPPDLCEIVLELETTIIFPPAVTDLPRHQSQSDSAITSESVANFDVIIEEDGEQLLSFLVKDAPATDSQIVSRRDSSRAPNLDESAPHMVNDVWLDFEIVAPALSVTSLPGLVPSVAAEHPHLLEGVMEAAEEFRYDYLPDRMPTLKDHWKSKTRGGFQKAIAMITGRAGSR